MVTILKAGNLRDADTIKQIAPAGEIMIFDAACPTGWTRVSDFDDKFLKGATTYGGTGGSDTHTHATTGITGVQANSGGNNVDGSPQDGGYFSAHGGAPTHGHTCTLVPGNADTLPPYIEVIYCKRDSY